MNSHLYFLRRELAMLGKIVMTLLAFSSAALAQQQQCQLECTLVKQSGEATSQKAATLWMLSNALWWPRPTPEGSRHAGDI
jgi:hypothetical protein